MPYLLVRLSACFWPRLCYVLPRDGEIMPQRSSRRRIQNLHKGEATRGTFFYRKKKKTAPASSFERVFERVSLAARLENLKESELGKGVFINDRQTKHTDEFD